MKAAQNGSRVVWMGMIGLALIFGLLLGGCVSSKEVTPANWQMEVVESGPPLNSLRSINAGSQDALSMAPLLEEAEGEVGTWYKFTAEERPGQVFYYSTFSTSGIVVGRFFKAK
ncbi:MAG: hypothetical protein LBQ61_02725 [Spirochaetales bacterium]|nr:hypothetical protein [Spirochaetales bacterium]